MYLELDKKIIDKIYEIINYEKDFYDTKEELVSDLERLLKNETQQIAKYELIEDTERLHKENQELKKQLENCYCNRTDCSSRIKDSKKYVSLMQKVESQQKMFIEWLEKEIENCKYGEENYADGDDMTYHNENELRKEILSKYKEIIGDKE